MNAEALTINDIIDFVKENIDDTKFAKDMLEISLRGFITALVEQEKEAYHKEQVNAEIIPFLNMINNAYKVINKDDDVKKMMYQITFKADELKTKLLK